MVLWVLNLFFRRGFKSHRGVSGLGSDLVDAVDGRVQVEDHGLDLRAGDGDGLLHVPSPDPQVCSCSRR